MQNAFILGGRTYRKIPEVIVGPVFDDEASIKEPQERSVQKSNAEELARRFNHTDQKLFEATIGVYEGRIHPDDLKASKHGVTKANVIGLIGLLPEGLSDNDSSQTLSRAIWNLIAPHSPKACLYTGKELQITLQKMISGEIKQSDARTTYGIPTRTTKRYMAEIIKYLGCQNRLELRASWANGDQERIVNAIMTLFPNKKKRGAKPLLLTANENDIAIITSVQGITSSGKLLSCREVRDNVKAHIKAQGIEELKDAEGRGDLKAIKRANRKLQVKVSRSFIKSNRSFFSTPATATATATDTTSRKVGAAAVETVAAAEEDEEESSSYSGDSDDNDAGSIDNNNNQQVSKSIPRMTRDVVAAELDSNNSGSVGGLVNVVAKVGDSGNKHLHDDGRDDGNRKHDDDTARNDDEIMDEERPRKMLRYGGAI